MPGKHPLSLASARRHFTIATGNNLDYRSKAFPPISLLSDLIRSYVYCTESEHGSGYEGMEVQLRISSSYCRVLNLL